MADYVYLNASGVIVPDTGEVLTEVQNEFKTVFGADLIVTPDTPQGVLIVAETEARSNVLRNNAALANQINPNIAGGTFLDAIWAIMGGARTASAPSTLAGVALTGVAGTFIPAGSRASVGIAGIEFFTAGAVTLNASGLATVDFIAVEDGPQAVLPGDLDTVVSAVLGWETVSNPDAAVVGRLVESDVSARRRRITTLGLQGHGGPENIIAALSVVDGVKSLTFRENIADSTVIIDGVSMVEHSIYVCVDGGTDAAIAATLVDAKDMGGNYNGGVTVAHTDPYSGQVYSVKFARPTLVPVLSRFTVKVQGYTGNPDAAVKAAVLAYVNGELEGEAGFVVGASVSPWELGGAVNTQAPGIYVQKVEVAPQSTGVFVTAEISIAIYEKATMGTGGITVIVV